MNKHRDGIDAGSEDEEELWFCETQTKEEYSKGDLTPQKYIIDF